MTETLAPATAPTAARTTGSLDRCEKCITVGHDIVGLFGHDPLGHRIVTGLLRDGFTARWQIEQATNLELLLVRDIGVQALERIRAVFPEPAAAPPLPSPRRPATTDGLPVGDATDAGRQRMALLDHLPAGADVSEHMLTEHKSAAALWALIAISRSDARIWRHVHPARIAFARIMDEEGLSAIDRMMLRLACSLAGRARHTCVDLDLPSLADALDDEQWTALLTALQVYRAGQRGGA